VVRELVHERLLPSARPIVVRAREQCLVRGAGDVPAARVELRLPEPRLIRLVADDDVFHRRERPSDLVEERDELHVGAGSSDRPSLQRGDREDDVHAAKRRDRQHCLDLRLVHDRRRLSRIPENAEPNFLQSDVVHKREGRGSTVGLTDREIVRDADLDRSLTGRGERESGTGEGKDDPEARHPSGTS
jgi:hypothetical protein